MRLAGIAVSTIRPFSVVDYRNTGLRFGHPRKEQHMTEALIWFLLFLALVGGLGCIALVGIIFRMSNRIESLTIRKSRNYDQT